MKMFKNLNRYYMRYTFMGLIFVLGLGGGIAFQYYNNGAGAALIASPSASVASYTAYQGAYMQGYGDIINYAIDQLLVADKTASSIVSDLDSRCPVQLSPTVYSTNSLAYDGGVNVAKNCLSTNLPTVITDSTTMNAVLNQTLNWSPTYTASTPTPTNSSTQLAGAKTMKDCADKTKCNTYAKCRDCCSSLSIFDTNRYVRCPLMCKATWKVGAYEQTNPFSN